jgi:hypothetical protein
MTVIVNTHNEEQEKALIAFLDNLQYEYQKDIGLTEEQQQEVLRRDHEFEAGNITSRRWDEIKKDLGKIYH